MQTAATVSPGVQPALHDGVRAAHNPGCEARARLAARFPSGKKETAPHQWRLRKVTWCFD